MLRVRGRSGSDAIHTDLDRALAQAERAAQSIGTTEARLARMGDWLDTHRDHPRWQDRRDIWRDALPEREALYDEIGALARQADRLWEQLGDLWGDPVRNVWTIKGRLAPFLGLFSESGDLAYGEPEQYAPIRR